GHELGERARLRILREWFLVGVHQLRAAFVDAALDIGDEDVLAAHAERDEKIEAGQRRGTRPGADELDLADVLPDELQAVQDACRDDDGRAVLVVVKDGNAHALLETALDLEAL